MATPEKTPEFRRFKELTRKLVAVPKAEIDAKRQQAAKNKARRQKPESA